MPRWLPHVTVAAVVERHGRYLCVEETVAGARVINQPAGHLEDNESLLDAVIRETREETRWLVTPTAVIGVYRWKPDPAVDKTFLRFTFACRAERELTDQPLDPDIDAVDWLDLTALRERHAQLRSPLVLRSIEDAERGMRFDLNLLQDVTP